MGRGGKTLTPMAVVMPEGLLSAVALNMLVVPALYLRYGIQRPAATPSARQLQPVAALERT